MEKKVTYRQFMRAWKRKVDNELIMSIYNKQQAIALAEEIKTNGITCNCERPVTYGVLTKKCHRCGHPLKK